MNDEKKEILYKSWVDTKYFTLLPQEEKLINTQFNKLNHKVYGNFKLWIEEDNVTYYKRKKVVIQDIKTNKSFSVILEHRYKRRYYKTEYYNLSQSIIQYLFYSKNSNNRNQFDELLAEVNKEKNINKLQYNKQKAKEYQNKIKKVCDTKGITKEEYIKQNKIKRAERKEYKNTENNVEVTNQIIKLAPLLSNIKDQIDIIFKKFNDVDNCKKLTRFNVVVRTCKSMQWFLTRLNKRLEKRKGK